MLTGSADVLMLPQVAETLAGRMEILRLWPLSQAEIEGRPASFVEALLAGDVERVAAVTDPVGRDDLTERVAAGGFPEAVARRGARRERWFDSYVETVVQREVRDLANIGGVAEIPRLLLMLAARAGGLVNHAELGRDMGIPQTTLKRYVALLEATFLIRTVPAWYRNIGKRLVKSPKLAIVDSGLMLHELGLDDGGHGALTGPLHFRTSTGTEVDAVLEGRDRRVAAVEVKAAATVTRNDFRGLHTLEDKLGDDLACGVVLHAGTEARQLTRRLWALPISALWADGG